MLAYWDVSLRCRFANQAVQRWFGLKPEDVLGRHVRDLLGPTLFELNFAHMQAALRGERQSFEREIPDPAGGTSRYGIVNYVPDVQDGVVAGFFVEVTDITQTKRAESALRQSEEHFRLTLDEAPIGMALVTPDGRLVRANRALCEILGYDADELMRLGVADVTHPDDLDTDIALGARVMRGELSRYTLEKRYIRKDRRVVDALLHIAALRGADGVPDHFIAQIEDVTERKRAEHNARILADTSQHLAATLDLEAVLITIAEIGARWLGDYCVVELAGGDEDVPRRAVASRNPANAWICVLASGIRLAPDIPHPLRTAIETRRTVLLERLRPEEVASFAQSDEHLRVLEAAQIVSAVTVPLAARGSVLGALAFVSSSPNHIYGAADAELAEQLAERAALNLQNARLYRAAQQAKKERDDVLGVVAHDLRNPLSNIVLQAGLLRRSALRGDVETKGIQRIETAARRIDRLIQDLLDVTRIETGHLAVAPKPTPARQLVDDAIVSQGPLAAHAGVDLHASVASDVGPVLADPDRILQVLENLVGNALKFTPRGGRIEVSAASVGSTVRFSVRDTGRGIPKEDLPHVFDRFWQRMKGEQRGAGLGLAIAKGIVDVHHGTMKAESAPGQGSTFSFTLPKA